MEGVAVVGPQEGHSELRLVQLVLVLVSALEHWRWVPKVEQLARLAERSVEEARASVLQASEVLVSAAGQRLLRLEPVEQAWAVPGLLAAELALLELALLELARPV